MLLLRNADIFAPSPTGRADILIAGGRIERIEPGIRISEDYCAAVDVSSLVAVPGLIDAHVHVTGGGGEGGYATRTPELQVSDAISHRRRCQE